MALRAGPRPLARCPAQRGTLASLERVRRKLAGADDGNRQMVDILTAVLTDGLPAVEAACAEAITHGVHSADVVLNIRHAPIGRLCPLRQPQEDHLMERSRLFDLMGELKVSTTL
jgi:hypothetical protein